jgi:hypothetical protein
VPWHVRGKADRPPPSDKGPLPHSSERGALARTHRLGNRGQRGGAGFELESGEAGVEAGPSSDAWAPQPAFVRCYPGRGSFELGKASAQAAELQEAAWAFLQALVPD